MKAINIKFDIETLEDFHIGTGLDCVGLYDDGQVKDKNGNPAIRSETLKGLIKQSCLEVKRNLSNYNDAFNEIFDFRNLGSLDLFIDYDEENSPENPFIIHTFTAIDDNTGTGKEGSLRDIEFGSKGCRFKVELHFEIKNNEKADDIKKLLTLGIKNNEKADDIKKLLTLGIKNLKWFGGYRRRGFGAIKYKNIHTSVPVENNSYNLGNSLSYKILLQLKDNVCLAGAGQTGNHLHTLDYIGATTILGMFRNVLLKVGKSNDNEDWSFMDDGNIAVSNFYPTDREKIDDSVVIPVPLSLRKNKAVNQYSDYYMNRRKKNEDKLEIPHWALDMKPINNSYKKAFQNIVSQDTLIDDGTKDQEGFSDKSISDEYLILDNEKMDWNTAYFFKPDKEFVMRNFITPETQATKDDAVFTQDMISKGTLFTGTITFKDTNMAKRFKEVYSDWLNGKYNFHVGRGGKPIKLVDIKEIKEKNNYAFSPITTLKDKQTEKQYEAFTITLLSDVILYNEKLMPETVIHPKYLGLKDKVKLVSYVASNRIHQSFSGLAGLRRFSDRVISKGSCFLYELNDNAEWNSVKKILENLQKKRIGFKTDEGFGQVAVNLSVHQIKKTDISKPSYKPEIDKIKYPKFMIKKLTKIDELHNKAKKLSMQVSSESFINRIIAYMESNYSPEKILKEIAHGKDTSSSEKWKDFEKIYNDENLNKDKNEIIKILFMNLKKNIQHNNGGNND